MRNLGIPLVLLLSAAIACEQQPAAPTSSVATAFASGNLDKNQVLRYQDHFAASWTDANSNLRATHTTFPIPLFGEPEPDCGPQADLAMIDFKQVGVVNPIDFFASELHLKASGPVWVIV